MGTLAFQIGVSLLALLFGTVALLVYRSSMEQSGAAAASWMITGVGFALGGLGSVVQDTGAVWAFIAGPESIIWAEYVRWAPAGNHGRSILRIATGVLLVVIALYPGVLRRRPVLVLGSLFTAMLFGSIAGWMEGPLREAIHYSNAAVVQVVEVIAILLALFLGAIRSSMDRLLFAALGIYAFRQALNVLSLSAFAWLGTEGAWAPEPIHIQIYGTVGYILMSGLALRRLALARRNAPVPGLLDPPTQDRPAFLR